MPNLVASPPGSWFFFIPLTSSLHYTIILLVGNFFPQPSYNNCYVMVAISRTIENLTLHLTVDTISLCHFSLHSSITTHHQRGYNEIIFCLESTIKIFGNFYIKCRLPNAIQTWDWLVIYQCLVIQFLCMSYMN